MKMLLKSMCGNLTSFIEAMRYPCTHLSCMKMLLKPIKGKLMSNIEGIIYTYSNVKELYL